MGTHVGRVVVGATVDCRVGDLLEGANVVVKALGMIVDCEIMLGAEVGAVVAEVVTGVGN